MWLLIVWLNPLIFIKYLFEKKYLLKNKIKKKKKKKKNLFAFSKHPIPHHQKNNSLEVFKNPTFMPSKQPNFSLRCHPRNNLLGLVPIPKKNHLSQSLKKSLLWKGVELPHPPLLTQKKPFWKRKKNCNPLCPFLKAPFSTCNSFNLIELSTLYTY